MADGALPRSRELLADGVYLDLPLADYLADPALSGSAFKTLLVDPPGWKWDRPENPLRERVETRPQLRGSAAHCAILEGLDAYEARYCRAPEIDDFPDALDTMDDLRAWLKARDLKVGGTKAELVARVLEHDGDAPIWSVIEEALVRGRTPIKRADDAFVRMQAQFVRSDPAFAPLVSGGLPEVTIVFTVRGVRYKARPDYLNPLGILEAKTFGQPPAPGRTLLQHVLREAALNGYDMQAVHNHRAVAWMAEALADERIEVFARGSDASARIDRLYEIAAGLGDPAFHWLFLRMGSFPTGIAVRFGAHDRFDNPDQVWEAAERKVEAAVDAFEAYSATCGDGVWMRSDGVTAADVADWPLYVTEIAGDIR